MSSVHSSQVGIVLTETPSEAPVPRRSKKTSRLNAAKRVRNSTFLGTSHANFNMASKAEAIEEIERTVTDDLVGDIGLTHGYVSGLGRVHICITFSRPSQEARRTTL